MSPAESPLIVDAQVVAEVKPPNPITATTALVPAAPQAPAFLPPQPVTARQGELKFLAYHAAQSGMFKKFPNPSAAYMVLEFGDMLGLAPAAALTSVHFINGNPVMGGNGLWALVLRDREYRKSHVVTEKTSDRQVTLRFIREIPGPDGRPERILDTEHVWDEKDNERAGLSTNPNHKKYPRAMKFNRAVSSGIKLYAAHLGMGYTIYTPDELGVAITETGDADVTALPTPAPTPWDESLRRNTSPGTQYERMRRAITTLGWTVAQVATTLGLDSPAKVSNASEEDAARIASLLELRIETDKLSSPTK